MKYKIKIIASIFLVAGILLISGCGCKSRNPKQYDLSLEIWGAFDYNVALREILENYRKINPNIRNITYKKLTPDTYKSEILEALASGQGPDIFLIRNSWVPSFENKIMPAPQVEKVINEQKFINNFVDVAVADFVKDGKIYAVPLSVDSLGLYYNKDLFNQAGIATPPRTWNEFIEDVRKLTRVDANGEVNQSGAAIGTAYNINRSTDILTLLMLQSGTEMINERGRVSFDSLAGENALNFYVQFANLGSLNYSWNPNMHYSIDAFSEGKTAMMINYSWNMKTVEDRSPKLNYAVAPVPQFENQTRVNFANYWGYAVAKNKIPNKESLNVSNETRAMEAWKFLTYLTTKPDGTFTPIISGSQIGQTTDPNLDPAKSYLTKSGEPAARRDLIELQKSDPKIGIFAVDNLIAKSWEQVDPDAIEIIFAEMIDSINKGQSTVSETIKAVAQRVQNLSIK